MPYPHAIVRHSGWGVLGFLWEHEHSLKVAKPKDKGRRAYRNCTRKAIQRHDFAGEGAGVCTEPPLPP